MFNNFTDRFFHNKNKVLIDSSSIKGNISTSRDNKTHNKSKSKTLRLFDNTFNNTSRRNSLNNTMKSTTQSDFFKTQNTFIPPPPVNSYENYDENKKKKKNLSKTGNCFSGGITPGELHTLIEKHVNKEDNKYYQKGNSKNDSRYESKRDGQQFQLEDGESLAITSLKDKLRRKIQINAYKKFTNAQNTYANKRQQKVDEKNILHLLEIMKKKDNRVSKQQTQKQEEKPKQNQKHLIISSDQQEQLQKQSLPNKKQAIPKVNNQIKNENNDKRIIREGRQIYQASKGKNGQNVAKEQKRKVEEVSEKKLDLLEKKIDQRKKQVDLIIDKKKQIDDPDKKKVYPSAQQDKKTNLLKNKELPLLQQDYVEQKQKIKQLLKQPQKEINKQKVKQQNKIAQKQVKVQIQVVKTVKQEKKPNTFWNLAMQVEIPTKSNEPIKNKSIAQNEKFDKKQKVLENERKQQPLNLKKARQQPIKVSHLNSNLNQIQQKQDQILNKPKIIQPLDDDEIQEVAFQIPKNDKMKSEPNQKKGKLKQQVTKPSQKPQITSIPSSNQTKPKQSQKPQPPNNPPSKPKANPNLQPPSPPQSPQQLTVQDHKDSIEYILYIINQIVSIYKKQKQFVKDIEPNGQVSRLSKLSSYYVWRQMYYVKEECLRCLDLKDGDFYGVQRQVLEMEQLREYIDQEMKGLSKQIQGLKKYITKSYQQVQSILSASQKPLKITKQQNYHKQCLSTLKQYFQQLQKNYRKSVQQQKIQKQSKYIKKLCQIIQIVSSLKYLNGEQIKEYQDVEQINDYMRHYQGYKHLVLL